MNCREFAEFLDAYVAGELPPGQAAEFDAHLGECDDCVAYLHTYRATIALARGSAADPPPLPEELVAAILAVRPEITP